MTKAEIISAFDEFAPDSELSDTLKVFLAEQARIKLETELRLQISKKLDTSQASTVGGTYLTPLTLPSDILVPAGQRIYVGSDAYIGIPFEDRMVYKDSFGFWYFDLLNGQFYLTGTQSLAQQITFPYITSGTTFIDAQDEDTILKYPKGFHIIIPMEMAQIHYAADGGDKSRSWIPEWLSFYEKTKQGLIDWDAQWKLANIGHATPANNLDVPRPYAINTIN